MSLSPLSELQPVARSLSVRAFAGRYIEQDAFVLEPWDKERDYNRDVHPGALWTMLPRDLNRPIPVGRDERALIQIDHAAVSRLHAILAWTGDGWKIMDRSSNGTWLSGERLPAQLAVPVPYGGMIRLGRAFVLRVLTPEAMHGLLLTGGIAAPVASGPLPPSDPRAETWRFPALQADGPLLQAAAPPTAPPPLLPPHSVGQQPPPFTQGTSFAPAAALSRPGDGGFELDFDFADAPPILRDEAPEPPAPPPPRAPQPRAPETQRQPRPPQARTPQPQPPSPPRRPGMPAHPAASPDPEFTDEIEFDFGSKFDQDGRGGFA